GLDTQYLVKEVSQRSRLIRLEAATTTPMPGSLPGPRTFAWDPVVLGGAVDAPPSEAQYTDAAYLLAAQRDVALMVAPDLRKMFGSEDQRDAIFGLLVALAESTHDRQLVGDVPLSLEQPADVLGWLAGQRQSLDEGYPRSVALYHPRLR